MTRAYSLGTSNNASGVFLVGVIHESVHRVITPPSYPSKMVSCKICSNFPLHIFGWIRPCENCMKIQRWKAS